MYFLIEHNRKTKDTLIKEYQYLQAAKTERFKREIEYLKSGRDEIEVVVFQSDSLENLKKTHSRYFVKEYIDQNKNNLGTGALVTVGLVALGVLAINALINYKDKS